MAVREDDMTDSSDEYGDAAALDTPEHYYFAINPQGSGVRGFAEYGFKSTAAHHKGGQKANSAFPSVIIRKEDMKIKDVVMKHVLPFLPAKSLMKFRTVSKEWNQWIVSPLLAYNQSFSFQKLSGYFYQKVGFIQFDPIFMSLDHSVNGVPSPSLHFLPEKVKIISCSSGLLLCQGWDNYYYLCNPATKDWERLPRPQYYHGYDPAAVLAFDPHESNIESYYHIVAAVPLVGQPVVLFEIYSAESNSWRCSSSECFELENSGLKGGGIYMKGVAYWNTSSTKVLTFDVKNEIPAVLHVPIQLGRRGALTQIGNEVCYVAAYNESGNVFVIDIYGGMRMSLKHSVSVNLGPKKPLTQVFCGLLPKKRFTQYCETLPCINSDTLVILTNERMYFYHLKEKKVVETLKSPVPLDSHYKRFLPYMNSLVKLTKLKK